MSRQNGRRTTGEAAQTTFTAATEIPIVEVPGHLYRMQKIALGTILGISAQAAGKAVVADANVNIGVTKVTALHNGTSGSETQVTATAAELNILDGVTANYSEINFLDNALAGTQVASKAVIADANVNTGVSKITELHIGASGSEARIHPATNPGGMAAAYIDFNATAEPAMSVTINGVVYLEADAEDFPNGIWTNGASAANSAASLISAINGDTRAAAPCTAIADLSGDGAWLFWDAVGTAGNVTISTTSASNCTVQNSTGGEAAAVKKVCNITHTVNTQELLSGAVEIPIPFTPTGFNINAFSSTGTPIYFTDLVTIQASPARIRIDTDGATNLANTNVVHLTAWE
jgi:hypothetical protein